MSPWRREASCVVRLGEPDADALDQRGLAHGLEPLVAEFERELDTLALRRGARLACVVGGAAVRHAVVPWQDELSSPPARQRLAEQVFFETYGEAARGWTVCQHSERYGVATLACAVDAALLDRIDAAAQSRGLAVVSLQSALVHSFNAVRRSIAPGLFWFGSIEGRGTALLLMSPRGPLHAKRVAATGAALAGALDREWFSLGVDAERCPVYVVGAPAPRDATASRWRFIELAPAARPAQQRSMEKAA